MNCLPRSYSSGKRDDLSPNRGGPAGKPQGPVRLPSSIIPGFRRPSLGRLRAVLLELFRPDRRQLADLLRIDLGQVFGFGPVGVQVVQLPRAVFPGRDDLPVTDAKRPVALVKPPQPI